MRYALVLMLLLVMVAGCTTAQLKTVDRRLSQVETALGGVRDLAGVVEGHGAVIDTLVDEETAKDVNKHAGNAAAGSAVALAVVGLIRGIIKKKLEARNG